MTISLEVAKTATLAVMVPLAVFTANWVHRSNKGYPQTAAADFLLGVLIFDATVILATDDFKPFLRSEELREMIAYWHFIIAFVAGLIWVGIVRWAEPMFAAYYEKESITARRKFPIFTFITCWFSVLILIAFHVGFFALKIQVSDHA